MGAKAAGRQSCPSYASARRLPLIFRCNIRAAYINCSRSSMTATRLRWSNASPAFRRTSFLKAADLFTSVRKDGDMKKVATIIYAVGWTQHSFGHADHPHGGDAAVCSWGKRRPLGAGGRQRASEDTPNIQGRDRHGGYFRQTCPAT